MINKIKDLITKFGKEEEIQEENEESSAQC